MIRSLTIGTDRSLRRRDGIPFIDISGEFHMFDWSCELPIYIYRSQLIEGLHGRAGELTVKVTIDDDLDSVALPVMYFVHHTLGYIKSKHPNLNHRQVTQFNSSNELAHMVEAFNEGKAFEAAAWGVGSDDVNLPGIEEKYLYTRQEYPGLVVVSSDQPCGHGGLVALMAASVDKGKRSIAPCGVSGQDFAASLPKEADVLVLGPRTLPSITPYIPKIRWYHRFISKSPFSTSSNELLIEDKFTLPQFLKPIPYHIVQIFFRMGLSRKQWVDCTREYSVSELATVHSNSFSTQVITGALYVLVAVFNAYQPVGVVAWSRGDGFSFSIKTKDNRLLLQISNKILKLKDNAIDNWTDTDGFLAAAAVLVQYLLKENVQRVRMILND